MPILEHATGQPSPSLADEPRPTLLTIAGFDPTAGAGIAADLKVFAAHGCSGVAAITALTVQTTVAVRQAVPVEPALLEDTLEALAQDIELDGIKIGMLGTSELVGVVARFLSTHAEVPVVLDPLLVSSSGHPLLDPAGLAHVCEELLPRVSVVTPNTDELRALVDAPAPPASRADVEHLAAELTSRFPHLTLIATGGHLAGEPGLPDLLAHASGEPVWIEGERVDTPATHGTGCGFSSALLCGLVAGLAPVEAARAAKLYVTEALRAAVPMGAGGGSMHHLYRLRAAAHL